MIGVETLLPARLSADAEVLTAGWARVKVEATRITKRRVTAFFIPPRFQLRAAPGRA
jgi:hypothetical protein